MHEDYEVNGCGHVSDSLGVRKAKAFWWILARMAGWDGTPACQSNEDCGVNGLCIEGICQVAEPFCGDGTCDIDEACYTCAEDCGKCGKRTSKPNIYLSPSKNWLNKLLELFVPRI